MGIEGGVTKMLIVDSHCHLNFSEFAEDFLAMIARAEAADVRIMQTICTRMSEFPQVLAIAEANPAIYCSVGVHPCNVGEAEVVEVADLLAASAHPKVIGLGETGLDYYHKGASHADQQESFRRHIAASRQTGLPVIVHSREADADTVRILEEETAKGRFPFLIHCFTASHELAEAVIALGGYISLSGILTFKNAKAIQESARVLPLEHLLVETDAPYLAPMPHRGTRNEPAYTRHVCEYLAKLKGITLAECAAQTTHNFFTLFTKATQSVDSCIDSCM
jgi:TatD DNase family protein